MVSLSSKKVYDDGGVALILKDTRVAARLTLEKVEKTSLVRKKYLLAFEEGRYWDLPSRVYAEKFFKAYCRTLGLNSDMLMDQFKNEYRTCLNWRERGSQSQVKPLKSPAFVIGPFLLKRTALALMIIGFSSYIGWEVNDIIQSPSLIIDSPRDNLVTSRQAVEITGQVEAESKLTINGQDVYTDKNGGFNEVLGLQPGLNFINFSAKKKYSQEKIMVRKIMVTSDGRVSQASVEDSPKEQEATAQK